MSPRFHPCDKLTAVSEYLTSLLRRPPVGWWDLLDIAIVSFIFYEFLKLIRGTRAVQMAAGSLLLVGLFYISRLAPLQTLNWMIRNMLVYVAFAAIVIFQSDIRRALAHFGQAPFFRYFNRQEAANETIEELVVAATMLSSQRIGAIIAIEREIGLRNYIESGIPHRRHADLRPDRHDLPAELAAARRRGDPAGGSDRGGGLLPAADRQSAGEPRARHAASRGDRADRGERRRGDRGLRGARPDRAGDERADRARRSRPTSCASGSRTFVVQRRGGGRAASAYDA